MKYYVIAGEASGDLHGSNLLKALQQEDPNAQVRCWGGDLMEAAGGELVKHYRDLAFMGFVEVVKNLRTILGNLSFCKEDILKFQPDTLILIDYPGFNMRIAKWAHAQGIRVIYYISPQIWAWNTKRVHQIKAHVDRMLVILPFEAAFYQRYDYKAYFVGHPLLDVVEDYQAPEGFSLAKQQPIALLPGSRRQEVERMLEVMLSVVPAFPEEQFVIGGAPSLPRSFYEEILAAVDPSIRARVTLLEQQTYPLLSVAKAALVASGTATLETALFKVPQVVCYRGNGISYQIAKRLVKVDYISLVNLIAEREVVKELIQHELTTEKLTQSLRNILSDHGQERLQTDYEELHQRLGQAGASRRAAKVIVDFLD